MLGFKFKNYLPLLSNCGQQTLFADEQHHQHQQQQQLKQYKPRTRQKSEGSSSVPSDYPEGQAEK